MNISELYEPMIGREIDAIPSSVRGFRRSHSSEELFVAVSRFALLAASPSQHGKHALLAAVAAKEIESEMTDRYDELLAECAIYASQARLPWSEPPITDPPDIAADHPVSLDEIRAAIAARDRLRGERWLAARLRQPRLARDFFAVAAEDLSDFGHKLIVAVGVWKLARIHGQPGSYAFLRVAVGEWTSYTEEVREEAFASFDRKSLIAQLTRDLVAEGGSLKAFHRLALYDAAVEASGFAGDESIERRVGTFLAGQGSQIPRAEPITAQEPDLPIYRLSRDFAEYLKAFAISRRLEPWAERKRILSAAKYNRDHAPSFEEWSFA